MRREILTDFAPLQASAGDAVTVAPTSTSSPSQNLQYQFDLGPDPMADWFSYTEILLLHGRLRAAGPGCWYVHTDQLELDASLTSTTTTARHNLALP
jgi:hypothetical protein